MFLMTLVAVGLAIALSGCGISKEAQSLIAAAEVTARERAIAFDNIKGGLRAKNADDARGVARYISAHSAGLHSQADALAEVVAGLADSSNVNNELRRHLQEEAATARTRVIAWALMLDKIDPADQSQAEYLEIHRRALATQADLMTRLAKELKPKKSEQ